MNFSKLLTPEQKENIKKRNIEKQRLTVGQVVATDTAGNEFIKTVRLSSNHQVIEFGGWCNYYLESTYQRILERQDTAEEFLLDIGGRNHKGYPVSVPLKEMIDTFEKAIKLKKTLSG